MISPQRRGVKISDQQSAISGQLESRHQGLAEHRGQRKLRPEMCALLGSPYGANPSTTGLWESAPKGARTVYPRLIFEAGCLVRSARAPKPEERRVGLRHPGGHSLWLLSLGQARESSPGCGAEHPAFKQTPPAGRLNTSHTFGATAFLLVSDL